MNKKVVTLITAGMVSMMSHAGNYDPIVGKWQTFDDRTGSKRAVIDITYNKKKGTYFGRLIKRNASKSDGLGIKSRQTCYKCPAPFTDQKIDGMIIVWNLKKDKKATSFPYKGGFVIDPIRGRIYNLETELSKSGNALKGRASLIGAKGIGRKQTWIRIK